MPRSRNDETRMDPAVENRSHAATPQARFAKWGTISTRMYSPFEKEGWGDFLRLDPTGSVSNRNDAKRLTVICKTTNRGTP